MADREPWRDVVKICDNFEYMVRPDAFPRPARRPDARAHLRRPPTADASSRFAPTTDHRVTSSPSTEHPAGDRDGGDDRRARLAGGASPSRIRRGRPPAVGGETRRADTGAGRGHGVDGHDPRRQPSERGPRVRDRDPRGGGA